MKKIWKILAIILIVVMIIFIIDTIYYKTAKVEPKDLYITKEESNEIIKACKGSYSWKEKGFLRKISVVADSIDPTHFDYTKVLNVNIGDKIYFNNYDWTKVSASIILEKDRKEIAKVPIESNLEECYVVVPEIIDGEYIIQINLKSNKGDVWYSVKVNIKK